MQNITPEHLFGSSPSHIDGLVQERRNSIAIALELVFLALTHRYVLPLLLPFWMQFCIVVFKICCRGVLCKELIRFLLLHLFDLLPFINSNVSQLNTQWHPPVSTEMCAAQEGIQHLVRHLEWSQLISEYMFKIIDSKKKPIKMSAFVVSKYSS